MFMRVHFIGNGKSKTLHKSIYGYKIGCNIPKDDIVYDVISVIDQKVLLHQQKQKIYYKPNQEIWCTKQIWDMAIRNKMPGKWQVHYDSKYRYNSGHHAIEHISKNKNIKFIELWGMDSMWTIKGAYDLTSEMDDRVKRPARPPLQKEWVPHWQRILQEHPNIKYTIHAPKGVETIDYGANTEYKLY